MHTAPGAEPTREAFCPYYHRAVELIGARWTGAIIRALLGNVTRFSELTVTIPGLSDRMLSERLKELEAEGVVKRQVTPFSTNSEPFVALHWAKATKKCCAGAPLQWKRMRPPSRSIVCALRAAPMQSL